MAKTSVALGNFDGVHLAHRRIIDIAVGGADEGLIPAIALFKVHPGEVVNGTHEYITEPCQREEILRGLGVEKFYYMDFKKVRDYSPRSFFKDVLVDKLNAAQVVCGFNYTFGRRASGDVSTLSSLCEEFGVKLCVAPQMNMYGEPISSTRIKSLIKSGEVKKAAEMLGRNFSYISEVKGGKHMGRELGFPTINQFLHSGIVVPRFGVYASDVIIGDRVYKGATNIGTSPTIPGEGFRSETYIHDFEGDLYGELVRIELKRFIRPEMKFSCVEELVERVNIDKEITRGY